MYLVSTVVLDDDNCKSFEIVETLARPFSIFVAFQLDRLDHDAAGLCACCCSTTLARRHCSVASASDKIHLFFFFLCMVVQGKMLT